MGIAAEPVRTWEDAAIAHVVARRRLLYGMRILVPGATQRLSVVPLASRSLGYFTPRVTNWPALAEGFDALACGLPIETLQVEFADPDNAWKDLNAGTQVRLAVVEFFMILPGLASSLWPVVWTGVVRDPGVGVKVARVTLTRDDFWLQSQLIRETVNVDRFPNADPSAVGKPIPLIYGSMNSTGITEDLGIVPLLPVDMVGLPGRGQRYLLSAARLLTQTVKVFGNTGQINAFSLTPIDARGFDVVLVDFNAQRSADEVAAGFNADCYGFESVGDGSGAGINTSLKQLEHMLREWGFPDDGEVHSAGLWKGRAGSAVPIDYPSWDEVDNFMQADMARVGTLVTANAGRAGSRYIADARTALAEVNSFADTYQIKFAWTGPGLIGAYVMGNHRRTKAYLDTHLRGDYEELGRTLDPTPSSSELTDSITVDYTYDRSAEKAQAGLTVRDPHIGVHLLRTVGNKWNEIRAVNTVILRPTGTTLNQFALTGGGTLHEVLDEVSSDSGTTMARCTSGSADDGRVTFPAMPAALTIVSVTLHCMARYASATGTPAFKLCFYDGSYTGAGNSANFVLAASFVEYSFKLKRNPWTTTKFTPEVINRLEGAIRVQGATAGIEEFTQLWMTVEYVAEQAGEVLVRETVSRDLFLRKSPIELLRLDVGPEWGSVRSGEPIAVSHQLLGADSSRAERRLYTKSRHIHDLNAPGRCTLELVRARPVSWYETHPALSAGIQRPGVAQFGAWKGAVGGTAQLRVFTRASNAWCADGTGKVVLCKAGIEEDSALGLDIFEGETPATIQGCFANDFGGWNRNGRTLGATIEIDPDAETLFEDVLGAKVAKLVRGSGTTDLEIVQAVAWTAVASTYWLAIDRQNASALKLLYWFFQRGSDSKYFRATDSSWQVAKTWNPIPAALRMRPADQYVVRVTGVAGTGKIGVGVPGTVGTVGDVHWVAYVGASATRTATPRVFTKGVAVTRAVTTLAVTCEAAASAYPQEAGSFSHGFASGWDLEGLPPGLEFTMFMAYKDANNYDRAWIETTTKQLWFRRRRAAANFDAVRQLVGTDVVRRGLGAFMYRWTGPYGTRDLPAYSHDVSFAGMPGAWKTAGALAPLADPFTLYLGTTNAGTHAANGSFQ